MQIQWERYLPRILIGVVLGLNLDCAFLFLIHPDQFIYGFELSGVGGVVAIQGMGLLFIMWSVPYTIAFYQPVTYRICLQAAIAMQFIGLMGETILFFTLPVGHAALRVTGSRFILFDAPGLLMLIAAWTVTRKSR